MVAKAKLLVIGALLRMCLLHMWAGPNKYGHKCIKWVKSKHLRAETRHRGLPRQ
jgi:hypothetical protein